MVHFSLIEGRLLLIRVGKASKILFYLVYHIPAKKTMDFS